MSEPLTSTEGLNPGDVVIYRIRVSKKHAEPFWVTRFAAVVEPWGLRRVIVLTLVLHPDPKWEPRTLNLRDPDTVVTLLPEDQWPQGVAALWMKHIHTGAIKLGEV